MPEPRIITSWKRDGDVWRFRTARSRHVILRTESVSIKLNSTKTDDVAFETGLRDHIEELCSIHRKIKP